MEDKHFFAWLEKGCFLQPTQSLRMINRLGLSSSMSIRLGLTLTSLLFALPLASCAPAEAPKKEPARLVRPGFVPTNPPPAVVAESALVIDAITGRVLTAKNADQRRADTKERRVMIV